MSKSVNETSRLVSSEGFLTGDDEFDHSGERRTREKSRFFLFLFLSSLLHCLVVSGDCEGGRVVVICGCNRNTHSNRGRRVSLFFSLRFVLFWAVNGKLLVDEQPVVAVAREKRIGLVQLFVLAYFITCGGPFGIEPSVGAAGVLFCLVCSPSQRLGGQSKGRG